MTKKPPSQPKGINQRQEGYCDGINKGPAQKARGVTYHQGFDLGRADRKDHIKRDAKK